jgi:hypothetical protein
MAETEPMRPVLGNDVTVTIYAYCAMHGICNNHGTYCEGRRPAYRPSPSVAGCYGALIVSENYDLHLMTGILLCVTLAVIVCSSFAGEIILSICRTDASCNNTFCALT